MAAEEFFVSVIIPVYNGEVFLADAVASVLEQNYAPLEIIIIDDGSTDRTREVAANLQAEVRYVYQAHQGLPATRNHGVRTAQGNVIAFLDVDDLWSKHKLALQLAHLKQNPSVSIVLGHLQLMRLIGSAEGKLTFEEWGAPNLAMSMCSALFRKTAFDQVGGFDETQWSTDDMDWFMRARERGIPILVHPEVVLYYRRHTHNMTNDAELSKQSLLGMLKKSLDRRAQQSHQSGLSLPSLTAQQEAQ